VLVAEGYNGGNELAISVKYFKILLAKYFCRPLFWKITVIVKASKPSLAITNLISLSQRK
jgi:hypothetical protein